MIKRDLALRTALRLRYGSGEHCCVHCHHGLVRLGGLVHCAANDDEEDREPDDLCEKYDPSPGGPTKEQKVALKLMGSSYQCCGCTHWEEMFKGSDYGWCHKGEGIVCYPNDMPRTAYCEVCEKFEPGKNK